VSFQGDTFLHALFSKELAHAAGVTVGVTTLSIAVATVFGLGLAMARNSRFRVLRGLAVLYIYIGRAIPTLLWLLLVWNALPQLVPALRGSWFTPFFAAVVALSFNEAAYMAEIIRAGMLAVDEGQQMAGRSLGMTPWRILRKIVLPQAFRVSLPAAGNEYIALLKLTSLASVISLRELLMVTEQQVSSTFRFAELYAAAAVWYLAIVSVFMFAQQQLERRMRWGSVPGRRGGAARRRRLPAFGLQRS
jgi:His/Glu/Gln/Arg/opine family amino acid ABC transporter permease subunit